MPMHPPRWIGGGSCQIGVRSAPGRGGSVSEMTTRTERSPDGPTSGEAELGRALIPVQSGPPDGDRPESDRPDCSYPDVVDLAPGDTATIAAVHAGLSAQSRYRRFQSARPSLPMVALRRLAAVQPGVHVVHVALLSGRPVGLIRWIRWGAPGCAELAYEVVDAAQGRGVGQALLRHATGSAAACGIEWFLVQVAADDEAQRRRVRARGGEPDPHRPGFHRLPVTVPRGRPPSGAAGPTAQFGRVTTPERAGRTGR